MLFWRPALSAVFPGVASIVLAMAAGETMGDGGMPRDDTHQAAPPSDSVLDEKAGAPDVNRARASLDATIRDKALAILRAGLRSRGPDDFWPAMHAAEGLTLAGHGAEVRAALEPLLATEEDARRRCGLARELVRAGDREKVAILAGIIAGSDSHAHAHAAESLFKVGESGDAAALSRAFTQRDHLGLRLMAAAALVRSGRADALAAVREALDGDDADGLMLAGWILGQIGDAADVEPLRARLEDAPTPLTRASLECALALLGDVAGLESLERGLSSPDDAIRTMAANMAGEARSDAMVPALVALLDDPVPDVGIRAAHSLLMLESRCAATPSLPRRAGAR